MRAFMPRFSLSASRSALAARRTSPSGARATPGGPASSAAGSKRPIQTTFSPRTTYRPSGMSAKTDPVMRRSTACSRTRLANCGKKEMRRWAS